MLLEISSLKRLIMGIISDTLWRHNGANPTLRNQLWFYQKLTFYIWLFKMPAAVLAEMIWLMEQFYKTKQFEWYKEGYRELDLKMREIAKRILYTTIHSSAMNGISQRTKFLKVITL